MKTLEAYWRALEAATWNLYYDLCSSCNKNVDDDANRARNIPVDVVKVLINEFKTRQSLRQQWDERRVDKIYQRRITEEYRPVARPIFDEGVNMNHQENNEGSGRNQNKEEEKILPKDLNSAIQDLQLLLGKHLGGLSTKSKKVVEKDFVGQSKPNQPDSTVATTVGTNGKEKIKKVDSSSGSMETDRQAGKHESNTKKKRKSKKKRK